MSACGVKVLLDSNSSSLLNEFLESFDDLR